MYYVDLCLTYFEMLLGKQFEVTIPSRTNYCSSRSVWPLDSAVFRFISICCYCLLLASEVTCALFNSLWGQTIANCWSRSQLGMPCTGLVQQTTRNMSLPFVHTARRSYRWTSLWVWGTGTFIIFYILIVLWKLKRTVWSKGKRSRNKASVGEPADGSLRFFIYLYVYLFIYIIIWNNSSIHYIYV